MPISSPQITTMFGLVVAMDPAIFDLLPFARESKVLVDVGYSPWGLGEAKQYSEQGEQADPIRSY
jgi:hypothetical protein